MTTLGDKPAYPTTTVERVEIFHGEGAEAVDVHHPGMTIRQHYAGLAMQGIIAGGYGDTTPHCSMEAPGEVAHFAVMYADALLAELERGR